MNAVTPINEMPTEAARLVKAIVGWYPTATVTAEWTKQATLALAPYGLEILRQVHARGQAEFKHFPNVPILKQLAERIANEKRPTTPSHDNLWNKWDYRAQQMALEAHRIAGWPKYWGGYGDTLHWLTKRAYWAIKANYEGQGKDDCPAIPSARELLIAMPFDLLPPQKDIAA